MEAARRFGGVNPAAESSPDLKCSGGEVSGCSGQRGRREKGRVVLSGVREDPRRPSGTPIDGMGAKLRRGTSGGGRVESGGSEGRRRGLGDYFIILEKFRGLAVN